MVGVRKQETCHQDLKFLAQDRIQLETRKKFSEGLDKHQAKRSLLPSLEMELA